MAISDSDARRFFEMLANQLREHGAGTLVDQVIDEIAQGRQIVYKTVASRKGEQQLQRAEGDEVQIERGRRRQYSETLEYSAHERLELLLEAIDRAIVDTARIDGELVRQFGSIRFMPEQEEEHVRSFELGTLNKHDAEIKHLRSLITEFREFIGE
jgi:hypothetical protein